ncbi:hypothetical protein G9A89_014225 [Geosiphon pyriformis]|nr:hypothetical protein G9A89_014225 [Geosiphon pyriformis]
MELKLSRNQYTNILKTISTIIFLETTTFQKPEDFQLPKSPIQQQKLISTSTNIIDYLQKNESNHSENLESKKTESKQKETTENEEKIATAYIAKISEFTGKDNDISLQKWLNKVQKTGDANGWNAAKMLKAISYFLQRTAEECKVAAPKSNSSNNTILPAQIAQNANLSDIFPFEFKANELPFLLSNAAVNKQKAITAMYTEAEVKRKPIWLILNNRLAGSIITYQLMQQLQRTVNRPAQTIIVIANSMKKTPVREINNFLFTINGITISVKVLVMNASQYQALIGNDWLFKTNANLDWKTQKLKILYQEQYIRVLATCSTFNKKSEKAPVFEFEKKKELPVTETFMALESTSNWAEETEQEIFKKTKE